MGLFGREWILIDHQFVIVSSACNISSLPPSAPAPLPLLVIILVLLLLFAFLPLFLILLLVLLSIFPTLSPCPPLQPPFSSPLLPLLATPYLLFRICVPMVIFLTVFLGIWSPQQVPICFNSYFVLSLRIHFLFLNEFFSFSYRFCFFPSLILLLSVQHNYCLPLPRALMVYFTSSSHYSSFYSLLIASDIVPSLLLSCLSTLISRSLKSLLSVLIPLLRLLNSYLLSRRTILEKSSLAH